MITRSALLRSAVAASCAHLFSIRLIYCVVSLYYVIDYYYYYIIMYYYSILRCIAYSYIVLYYVITDRAREEDDGAQLRGQDVPRRDRDEALRRPAHVYLYYYYYYHCYYYYYHYYYYYYY